MENALLVGLSRQMALTHELDVIANNIANINTTGYKADNAMFEEYLMPRASDQNFTGQDRRIRFVEDRASWIDMSQGAVEHTGNPLDVAIDGNGYLVVQTPNGQQRYTRNGALSINACRPARHRRRRSGDRRFRADHFPIHRSRRDHQPRAASSRCARATAPPIRRAAIFSSSTSPSRSCCRRTAVRPSRRPPASRPIRRRQTLIVVQGAIEKSNVNGVAAMARMIEITRSYTDIANVLQQQSDQRRSALSQLSQTPSS